ncbi:epoxide hydrolase family protein [Bacillus horti]|uniref:Pimeloyl-ACP methyl ester carboxylesterase n=1 Tax=Caldalkalibacillus horti TaxID=77523 RepID=A0ABT9VZK5_9BACI|nr:epoxide hydrolase family protein [Bacillus horti]MDQ0166431.1 pimeloyl-ACP methyl ester carboxylesterase [Bacillus horti]
MNIRPYTVRVDKTEIEELKKRLQNTRWPDEIEEAQWEYGIPLAFMKDMLHYWKTEFNWKNVEDRINSYANYQADIDGIALHFIYERGSGPNPTPLIIPHGWPSTFYEMLNLIPYLTHPERFGGDPEDSFDVIIPSLPGHGFSSSPRQAGFEDRQAAYLLVKLMEGLGYNQFAAHGYDLGASVLGLLCLDYPQQVIGYHTTSPGNPSPYISADEKLSQEERNFLSYTKKWYNEEGGYAHLLGTKPQTLAYALNDSPAGLAAFILEKWYLWTSPPSGELLEHFNKEDLLANVSIYWFTQTINAANRYYFEGQHTKWPGPTDRSPVPIGVSLTATQPHERPPREYVERLFPTILSWEELHTGGHFVAQEQPRLVAERIRSFFRGIKDSGNREEG